MQQYIKMSLMKRGLCPLKRNSTQSEYSTKERACELPREEQRDEKWQVGDNEDQRISSVGDRGRMDKIRKIVRQSEQLA